MSARHRRVHAPNPERTVRLTAMAYVVWHSIGTVAMLSLLVLTTLSLAEAYGSGQAPASVGFFGLQVPPILALGLLFLLTGALVAAGYLFGIGAYRQRWRSESSEKLLVRLGSGISALYLVGLLWAFTQADSVLFAYYGLSAFLAVSVGWQVRELARPGSTLLGRLPGEQGAAARQRIAEASKAFVEDYEVEQVSPGLQRIITGYCQLMVVWGSMEIVMALTYLSKVTRLWAEGADFFGVMGSGIITGFVVLAGGVYALACGVVNVRGRTTDRAMRWGVWLCFGGLIMAAACLTLGIIVLVAGAPDGVEQVFCATISTALMAASFFRTRERASWADAWRDAA